MKRPFSALLMLCSFIAAGVSISAAGTLTGVVRNGTTGTPAAGADVVLMQLQGGMEIVANTKTDPQGRYRIEHPGIGRQPMLVRAHYRGVNFHQNLPPGREVADIEVFDPTADPSVLKVQSRMIVFQPNGPSLLVGEEFSIQNQSKPPAAHFNPRGNFEFQLPREGGLTQVSAWGPSGMPVVQGTIDGGNNRHAIAFAFRPGENGVRLSYQMPYASNQAALRITSPYAAGRVLVLAPSTMQVASAGFRPAGGEQGFNILARDAVPAGTILDIVVSGTTPPPPSTVETGQTQSQGGDPGSSIRVTQVLPSRLEPLKLVLVGGFAALFTLGLVYLWRRPAGTPVGQRVLTTASHRDRREEVKQPHAEATSLAMQEVERAVNRSLDEMKESLFRLELRRQAGTISEEEYARERSRVEKVLRDLVKG